MPLYLLDTNILSYVMSGRSQACVSRFGEQQKLTKLTISSVTAAELWYGLYRIGAGRNRLAGLGALLSQVDTAPWAEEESLAYGKLRAELDTVGQNLSTLDMLIAAHAISLGATLVTHDVALKRTCLIKGIPVEDWATDL